MNQAQALDILKTGANVFLTGEPGSGKTHTINEYIQYLRRCGVDTAVTASTGIAATHLSGTTIHSWSGIGIRPKLNHYDLDKLASTEYLVKRISRAKVLVIDEVSMLGPETLTMVDQVCREIKDSEEAFGGMQIVLVGDFFQLPPVVKYEAVQAKQNYVNQESLWGEEIVLDEEEVKTPPRFAFSSPAWEASSPIVCYLTEQHRQDDPTFLSLLSAIRHNEFEEDHLEHLQKRKVTADKLPTGIPKLYTHNLNVDAVNESTLKKIKSEERTFKMITTGKEAIVATLKKGCLSHEILTLKIGAEVMFTKNKPKDGFVNGTLGIVDSFSSTTYPIVKLKSGQKIEVTPMMGWSIEENGKIKASLTQIPLRLAWAITVHKSQGLSMDAAIMDLRQVFEFGQGYVALSRVRRLSGIHILGWNPRAFQVHPEVFERDEKFRANSEEAEAEFGKLTPDELDKMHDNFVTASGGKPYQEQGTRNKGQGTSDTKKTGKTLVEIREKHANAFRKWDEEQEKQLKELFEGKMKIGAIAKQMGRKAGGIQARLEKIGLLEPSGKWNKRMKK